jgi:hypothetical protein
MIEPTQRYLADQIVSQGNEPQKTTEESAKSQEAQQIYQFFCWMCLPGKSSRALHTSCESILHEMRWMKSHGKTAQELYQFGIDSFHNLQKEHFEISNMRTKFYNSQESNQVDCCQLKADIDMGFESYPHLAFNQTPLSYGSSFSNLIASTAETASQAAGAFFKLAGQVNPNYDPFLPIPAMPLEPEKIDCCKIMLRNELSMRKERGEWEQKLKYASPNAIDSFYWNIGDDTFALYQEAKGYREANCSPEDTNKEVQHRAGRIAEKANAFLSNPQMQKSSEVRSEAIESILERRQNLNEQFYWHLKEGAFGCDFSKHYNDIDHFFDKARELEVKQNAELHKD